MATVKDKKAAKLSLGMRCGDCIHFKGPKSPLYKDKCSELGTKHYAMACQGFTPNFTVLNRGSGNLQNSAKIASLIQSMPSSYSRILGYMLCKQTSIFEKIGLTFGQPMYLFLEPTVGLSRAALQQIQKENYDYLENYYKAYAVGVQRLEDGVYELFLASNIEGKPDYYISISVKEERTQNRVFTREQFKPIRERLLEEGRKKMPKAMRLRLEKLHEERIVTSKYKEEIDEIRNIDNIPKSWWENPHVQAGQRRNKGVSLHKRKKGKGYDEDYFASDDKPRKKGKIADSRKKKTGKTISISLLAGEKDAKKKKKVKTNRRSA